MNLSEAINCVVTRCHDDAKNAGWWNGGITPETVPKCLMLIVSEVAEAMEGDRKGLMDDHLPDRKMVEVELADAVIRIADLAGALNLDLGGAIFEKLEYNKTRNDHKAKTRLAEGGKKY